MTIIEGQLTLIVVILNAFFDVDKDKYDSVREIFYNFSCYDALDFEVSTIMKTMTVLKEL
jgi:hypothetical protein